MVRHIDTFQQNEKKTEICNTLHEQNTQLF